MAEIKIHLLDEELAALKHLAEEAGVDLQVLIQRFLLELLQIQQISFDRTSLPSSSNSIPSPSSSSSPSSLSGRGPENQSPNLNQEQEGERPESRQEQGVRMDYQRAAAYVLKKNEELLRRLA